MKKLLKLIILWMIFIIPKAQAFDPPTCGDPWYYQSDDRYMFYVPDKAQHYYGSYVLTEIAASKFGNIGGSVIAFTLGFVWEVKDNQTALGTTNGGTVGFSYRDLIADGLGVLSNRFNKFPNTKFYLTYNTVDRIILFNATLIF